MLFKTANLSQLAEFDEIIDVRTPSEFADDHIPGAINCPVLSDEERITVGTLYKQVSPFEARKVGGALVAKNIAHHLETVFHDKPRSWKPMVYCWRGGQRSGAMSIILAQVGWMAHKLEGGYKTYRRHVLEQLETAPQRLTYRVVCGPTGSGKSRLLAALAETGHQVLDLEGLAQHRGSVLGKIPQHPQPSQKWFDSLLLTELQSLDPERPVYVESESKKIGSVALPAALFDAMHAADCLVVETPLEVRVAGLQEDYLHYVNDPEALIAQLQSLHQFHGGEKLAHWGELINAGDFAAFVEELLTLHYDPTYFRSLNKHYPRLPEAQTLALNDLSHAALCEVAKRL
jgi:tRNA 2-selenouridine synthase